MKYLCLIHLEDGGLDGLDAATKFKLDTDSLNYDKELEAGGHFIAAQALQSPDTARIVRVRNGEVSMTDGPYAETKEHLAGFILIEARDLNEAVRLASHIPMAEYASVEVRPIYTVIPVPA